MRSLTTTQRRPTPPIAATTTASKPTILVLGYFHRANLGDDAFETALPALFAPAPVRCISMDDAKPEDLMAPDVGTLVIGGGDVLNGYFLDKAYRLIERAGSALSPDRIYGISVGAPYKPDLVRMRLFDHVFVRSPSDAAIVGGLIGDANVTLMRDLVFDMPMSTTKCGEQKTSVTKITVCLAQPAFRYDNNPAAPALLRTLASTIHTFDPEAVVTLLDFNRRGRDIAPHEDDGVVHDHLAELLMTAHNMQVQRLRPATVDEVSTHFKNDADLVIAMRFHANVLAMRAGTPLVPMYVSSKVDKLLSAASAQDRGYRLPRDTQDRPNALDGPTLLELLRSAAPVKPPPQSQELATHPMYVYDLVMMQRKRARVLAIPSPLPPFDEVVVPRVLASLSRMLDTLDKPLTLSSNLVDAGATPENALDLARVIVYEITGRTHHPSIWGLRDKIARPDFDLDQSLRYVYGAAQHSPSHHISYHVSPPLVGGPPIKMVQVDPGLVSDFAGLHRSGWAWVCSGLIGAMDAASHGRDASTKPLLDVYVDRTFHWGRRVFESAGLLPYRRPWYGIVHHTFDETHSTYNCAQLFREPLFLASLPSCRGLIALSFALAAGLRAAVDGCMAGVPVYTAVHPMEAVPDSAQYKSAVTPSPAKVVQIGAWLRDPWALYRMPLASYTKTMSKAALRGREMERYFAPPDLGNRLRRALLGLNVEEEAGPGCCRDDSSSRGCCRGGGCGGDDPNESSSSMRGNYLQKGMLSMLEDQLASVQVLEHLDNDAYDKLLTENVAFLKLVDASAVNTALECLMRNTPLVVNRLPSLEEMFGPDYPGFYDNLEEAAAILGDDRRLAAIHAYLQRVDKRPYALEVFVDRIARIISGDVPPFELPPHEPSARNQETSLPSSSKWAVMSLLINRHFPPRYQPSSMID
jgi:polysaccharide pyruvyl transferase WcaK-like protein